MATRFGASVLGLLLALICVGGSARAEEPITRDTAVDPGPNKSDEPLAKAYSLAAATKFLDNAALTWQKKRECFTCHTNYAYLYARPAVGVDIPAHKEIRQQAELLVTERWPSKGPRWDAEVVATAAALAFNDAATTGKLHPTTKLALDKMWEKQRPDGGFSWIKCKWPPMELDDHYGVTLAAVAVGVAPEGYAKTEAAQKGLDGIRKWLKANEAPAVHHKMMMLWAATLVDGILTDAEKKETVDKLLSLQGEDGGWTLANLGPWQRGDDKPQDLKTSDGYGTGFTLFILRKAGMPANDARLAKGVAWLKANQRESGRWFTRSVFKDNAHFITHAGTAFAVMALKECGQIETADTP